MRGRTRSPIFAAAQMAAAFAMFPTLTPPHRRPAPRPYHQPGVNTVLMDWDLPKSKRAKRRERGRSPSPRKGGA